MITSNENAVVTECLARLDKLSRRIEFGFKPKGNGGELTFQLRHLIRSERFRVVVCSDPDGLQLRWRDLAGAVGFFPYISEATGRQLRAHGAGYVDTLGNCHIETKSGVLIAHVEGKTAR